MRHNRRAVVSNVDVLSQLIAASLYAPNGDVDLQAVTVFSPSLLREFPHTNALIGILSRAMYVVL